ncbi:MAG: hypothetical protein R6V07_03080 [Armatimonadota bacterium]
MAAKQEHIQKAQHNEDFSDCVGTLSACPEYHDWEAIAIFYSALHLVDAKLADQNVHPDNHSERQREVSTRLRFLFGPYGVLFNLAHLARYSPTANITASDVHKAREKFASIKAMCNA